MISASPSARDILRNYALTTVFCLAIAVLLSVVGVGEDFPVTLVISLSIGLSINTAFVLLANRMKAWARWYLAPLLITTVGLTCGLILAGLFIRLDPWLFFSSNYSSVVAGIFFGVVGVLMFNTREELLQARAALAEAHAASLQQDRRMLETELRLLQAQIEPHFLFNTLGNIASLVHSNPDGAEAMLQNLARLLRASLRRTRDQLTTLGEELDIVTAYLDIQSVRMGDRLGFSIDVPESLRALPLPPLLLQPLVENAVLHGLDPKLGSGTLSISATRTDRQLRVQVTDDGVGFDSSARGNGIGLRNIRERLQGLYGERAELVLLARPTGGITAELQLPVETE